MIKVVITGRYWRESPEAPERIKVIVLSKVYNMSSVAFRQ